MSKFVRASKYRHVFGTAMRPENCFENTSLTKTAWDSNYICANNTYFAMSWGTAGGGAVGVVPFTASGKLPLSGFPMLSGHKNHVLDLDWNPFNQAILATASEDCYTKIWAIPQGGLKENIVESEQTLKGHKRKVGTVMFHPSAENVVATTSQDFTVKVWDIEKGTDVVTCGATTDLIQSFDWNRDGSLMAITCKDKKNRVSDPRTGKFEHEFDGHAGVKGSRVKFLKDGKVFTVGFGKSSERQFMVFDSRNPAKPLVTQNVDNSSGILMPFFDWDTSMLYLAGKGDGNIRYYEYVDDDKLMYPLADYKGPGSTAGGCMLPKTALAINENEVARFLQIQSTKVVPIQFCVPRKSDLFQDDIFPDTASGSGIPGEDASAYFSGQNAEPKTVSLANGFTPKVESGTPQFQKVKVDDDVRKSGTIPKSAISSSSSSKALDDANARIAYLEEKLRSAGIDY